MTAQEALEKIKSFADNAGNVPTAMNHIRATLREFFSAPEPKASEPKKKAKGSQKAEGAEEG